MSALEDKYQQARRVAVCAAPT